MKLLHTLLLGASLILAMPAFAHDHEATVTDMPMSHEMMGRGGAAGEELAVKNTIKLILEPTTPLESGKTGQVVVKLSAVTDGKPLSFDDLKEAHTKKLHLLVVDPSLSDYHHIHPVAGKNPGEYVFDFTPLKNGQYRVWADVIPMATGKQEYVQADMGMPAKEKANIDKTTSMSATVDG